MASTTAESSARLTITVQPMLSLGAPFGVLIFRDVAPTETVREFVDRVQQRLIQSTLVRRSGVGIYLYRVNLSLDAFPGRTSWRFLSNVPLSQLLQRCKYPKPLDITDQAINVDAFTENDGIKTPHDPTRVIHLMAELIEALSAKSRLPPRRGYRSQQLQRRDPDAFAQLRTFLSSPPEPVARTVAQCRSVTSSPQRSAGRSSYPRPPFYLNHVPAFAHLTLPKNKLLVRPVFVKLLDDILSGMPGARRFVYVVGTSGAGKTAFVWSILHALCHRGRTASRKHLAPPMDIVLDTPGLFALIDSAGQVFSGPRGCFPVELMKRETLYLVDLAHGDHEALMRAPSNQTNDEGDTLQSPVGHASRILVGLPRYRVVVRAQLRCGFVVKLLPPWVDSELELCRRACFPALDRSLLVARTQLWGRQPLWTLSPDPSKGVAEQRLLDLVNDTNRLELILDAVVENHIKDDLALSTRRTTAM